MRKTLVSLTLFAALALVPGLVATASADDDCYQGRRGGYYGSGYNGGGYGGSAWDIVRSDPCRHEEFVDYARRHENPNKRRRFIERLAREGCSQRYGGYDDRYDGRYAGGYGDPYGYNVPYNGGYYAGGGDEQLVVPLMGLLLNR